MRATLVPSLLFHPYTERAYADFPLGVMIIASVLERRGIDVSIKDLNLEILDGRLAYGRWFYEAAATTILDDDPDIVGFSSLCTSFLQALRIAVAVKQRKPATFVIFGGPNVSFVAESALKAFPGLIDAVVKGEGEVVTGLLMDALQGGHSIDNVPGVLTPKQPIAHCNSHPGLIENLDELPPPAWHLYPVEHGLERGYWTGIEIEAGRGCPFKCTFCTTNLFWEKRYRVKSARALVGEVMELRRRYGVNSFSMVHDLFTCRKKWVSEVCEEFIAHGSPVKWSMSARADTLTPELIGQLSAAGCTDIYFGVETGSPRMQQIIKKWLKLESVRQIIGAAQEHGIRATTSFILGFPEEQLDDLEHTLEMFCIYKFQERAQLHLLALYPGIKLINGTESLHFDEHLPDGALNLHSSEDLKWVRDHPDVFLNYYYAETQIDRDLLKNIQGYYLAITSYLAHLVTKHAFGIQLVDLAKNWLDHTEVQFDSSRLNTEKLREMAADSAVILRSIFEQHGYLDLFEDICRFQRFAYATRQDHDCNGISSLHQSRTVSLSPESRFVLRSQVKVLDFTYDIPRIAESISCNQPIQLLKSPCRYFTYVVNDRVRCARLSPFTAEFLALCAEGHTLQEIVDHVFLGDQRDPNGFTGIAICVAQANELLSQGILRTLAA